VFEHDDEENEFWSHVPDSRLDRFRRTTRPPAAPRPAARPAGSRTHSDHTGSIPVITAPLDTAGLTTKVREATQHVDPLIRRMGVLAVVVALLVPIALTLRSGGDDALQPDTTTLDAATTAPVGAAPAVAAPADSAAGNPFASIDVDALPPAVPVNPDPAPAAAPQADVATSAAQPAQAAAPAVTVAAARTEAVKVAPVCAAKYTVAAGDAWILIANRAGVTTKALLAVNGATTSTPLYPGRSICLPAGATTPTAPKVTTTTTKKVTTTTVKPTTTTAKKVAPAKTYTRAQVEAIIREIWPDELEDEAVRIATRESNLVPTAQNYCCTGLFQIYFSVHKSWLAKIGVTSAAQLKDPRVNAFAALVLYNRSGSWAPWRL